MSYYGQREINTEKKWGKKATGQNSVTEGKLKHIVELIDRHSVSHSVKWKNPATI